MPTPERDVRYPSPSGVPMKDLLASCAAASAVSTPPSGAPAAPPEDESDPADPVARGDRSDATAAPVHGIRPPAQREAA
ncbi:hypothetical protein ACFYPN_10410 [Streptomyces sp. NPDC005576]|uniref:hypothetical protein n=1 Tax=unclassified Streptomyces TaxID=2593676 RepID=UPI0033DF5D95